MRKPITILILFVLLLYGMLLAALALDKTTMRRVRNTTHVIGMRTLSGGAGCSATAIAPHALLTATHCERPTDELYIDDGKMLVLGAIRDGSDHTILLVDGTFDHVAEFSSVPVEQGDEVFIFGNPAGRFDLLREGYMVGVRPDGVLLFDMNIFHGDSGSAIFDESGRICAVVSVLDYEKNEEQYWSLTGAYPMKFTQDQLKKAREFNEVAR